MTFRLKLTIGMITLGIVVVTMLTFFMTVANRESLIESTLKNNRDLAAAISLSLDNYLDELAKTTQTLATSHTIKAGVRESNRAAESEDEAERTRRIQELNDHWINIEDFNDPFVQKYLSNPIALLLKEQEEVIPDLYGEIFLTNKYGELIASTDLLTTFFHGEKYWWLATYNDGEGRVFFDDRGYDLSVGDFVLGVTVPVYDNNQCVGILKSNLKILPLFNRIIQDYGPLSQPGIVKIARSDGLIVLEPEQQPFSTKVSQRLFPIFQGDSFSGVHQGENGQDFLVSLSPIKNTTQLGIFGFGGDGDSVDQTGGNRNESWAVILEVPKKDIEKVISDQTKQFLLVGFLSIFVMSLAAFFFSKRATQGIVELVDLTNAVGHGNLDTQVKIRTNDEIGILAHSFNQMIVHLRETTASKNELAAEISKRIEAEERLKHLSQIDDLTQLYNRRAFNDYLQKQIECAQRYPEPLSIAMIDIDYFKGINDSYGHSVGDTVLAKLSQILSEGVRKADTVARWGGEEFIILMPKTDAERAFQVAERLRTTVKDTRFSHGISVSISAGVTQFSSSDQANDLIKRVDQALYKAKAKGKDNVQVL